MGRVCAYKLDMAKAHDGVDWYLLKGIFVASSFSNIWIKWKIERVTSVTYYLRCSWQLLECSCCLVVLDKVILSGLISFY